MTSLRRRVEYLWKAEGNRSDDFVEDEWSQKCRIASQSYDGPFICVRREVFACFIVNEIEEIISKADTGYKLRTFWCTSARESV